MPVRDSDALPVPDSAAVIEQFLDALWAERGLSRNTLQSYRYDLTQLALHQRDQGRPLPQLSSRSVRPWSV